MLHLKKPILIRKLILLLSVLTLLIPMLAGCQSAQTPSHESSYEPLSAEKIKEINAAWETSPIKGYEGSRVWWDLTSDMNYYGTHGECVVIQSILLYGGDTGFGESTEEIAGIKTTSKHLYYFIVYHNGEFVWLREAYEQEWMTKDNLLSIYERFENKYPEDVEVIINE